MNLHALRFFHAVASTGSVTRASELAKYQPARHNGADQEIREESKPSRSSSRAEEALP